MDFVLIFNSHFRNFLLETRTQKCNTKQMQDRQQMISRFNATQKWLRAGKGKRKNKFLNGLKVITKLMVQVQSEKPKILLNCQRLSKTPLYACRKTIPRLIYVHQFRRLRPKWSRECEKTFCRVRWPAADVKAKVSQIACKFYSIYKQYSSTSLLIVRTQSNLFTSINQLMT